MIVKLLHQYNLLEQFSKQEDIFRNINSTGENNPKEINQSYIKLKVILR